MTAAAFSRTIIFMIEPSSNDELPPAAARKKAWLLFFLVAAAVTALDLWSKDIVFDLLEVRSTGAPARIIQATKTTVISGFFDLEANYNYGAFNGWFSQHTKLLALLSCAALLVIASVLWYSLGRSPPPGTGFILALGFLAGGTAGNFYDRFELQAVRDWIKWYVVIDGKEYVWPNFNIADSGICLGVGLILFLELFGKKPAAPEEKESPA